jgi:hypothetical protein
MFSAIVRPALRGAELPELFAISVLFNHLSLCKLTI